MYATFFTCVTLTCDSVFFHESSGLKIGVYDLECDMNNIAEKKLWQWTWYFTIPATFFVPMIRAVHIYSNLHDFGDAAPSVDNSPGHWRRSLHHPLVWGKGGGGKVLCPSFEQKDDAKIAASAGGYIRIARQWRFLVVLPWISEVTCCLSLKYQPK